MADVNKGFWYFILGIFNDVYTPLAAIVAIIVAIYAPFDLIISLSAELVISISIIYVFVIVTLCKSSFELYSNNIKLNKDELRLPKVIQGRVPYTSNPNAKALLLLEPSESFGYNILVSLYYFHGKIEQLIGFGVVINIQEGKFIQVEINFVFDGQEGTVERMKHNDAECLKKARVKPFIPMGYLDHLEEVVVNDGE